MIGGYRVEMIKILVLQGYWGMKSPVLDASTPGN